MQTCLIVLAGLVYLTEGGSIFDRVTQGPTTTPVSPLDLGPGVPATRATAAGAKTSHTATVITPLVVLGVVLTLIVACQVRWVGQMMY